MPEGEQIVGDMSLTSSLELTSSLINQLQRALFELKSYEDVSSDDIQWEDVEGHFRCLESQLKKKVEELEVKEKLVTEKESLIAEREAAVAAKEQDLLDRVQELKDAAVAAIMEATAAHKVSCSVKDEIAGGKSPGRAEIAERVTEELTQFCARMDSKGLLNYVMENLNNLSAVCRKQLSVALGSATDPARLVLDALGGFFSPTEMTEHGEDGKDPLQCTRQSCLVLMEALSAFLAKADSSADNFLNPEIKQHAKAIADEWKPNLALDSIDAVNGKSLEARAFLWLLISFRIASEFDADELCKHVLATAHHRQATELCRSLELAQKMPGLVETLIENRKQIEAVNFIMSFQLSETFPPVPLLRTYMKDVRRNLQANGDADAQNECNLQELAAIKAVMRCVKEYKLEAEHPLDPLRKRFVQLQNSIRDRKRNKEKYKVRHQKESQSIGGFYGSQAHVSDSSRLGPPLFSTETAAYAGVTERYTPAVPSAYNYPLPSQSPYAASTLDQRTYSYPVSGQSAYGAEGAEPRPYYYAQDDRISASYSAGAPSYGAYMQSSQQPYM